MSEDIDNILKEYGQQMVDATAEILVDDTRGMIMNREALTNPEQEGSGVEAVAELSAKTINKYKKGFSNPSLPRFRTGAMLDGIKAEYGDLTDTVVTLARYSEEQQTGEWSSGFPNPVPRPFFGISDRALKQATAECQKIVGQFIAATNGRTIQGEITVSA